MKLNAPHLWIEKALVGDRWIETDETIDVYNPFDGERLGAIPLLPDETIVEAIECSEKAAPPFARTSAFERSQWLKNLAALMEKHHEDLATMMTAEQGKPLKESRGEINYSLSFIKWFAEEAPRINGEILPSETGSDHHFVIKQPVGPAALITPWNFPSAMIARKGAPALAAGCPIIIKPSKETPFSAIALVSLMIEAGFPPCSVQLVTGKASSIGAQLARSPSIRKLSFTGSTEIGKTLMSQCSETVKKLSLELGGNAPCIIFDDASLSQAVEGTMATKFRNGGQTCISANRIFVQKGIYKAFIDALIPKVRELKTGSGFDPDTDVAPLINEAGISHIEEILKEAQSLGAHIRVGGTRARPSSLLMNPTLLENVQDNMRIYHEEIFGPVASIIPFESEAEVLQKANGVPYGLASYFFSQNPQRIFSVSQKLEYGMVGVNTGKISHAYTPFSGIKESGIGVEGSSHGIEEYLETKYICYQE